MTNASAFWLKSIIMPPLRSRAGEYCGGHLAEQLVIIIIIIIIYL